MDKITPLGANILVLPKEDESNYKTESGIEIVNNTLEQGTVVEVSEEFKHIYKVGETVIFSKGSGVGQMYNTKSHIWLNGNPHPIGDIKAKITVSE